jgi:hypothetical protein
MADSAQSESAPSPFDQSATPTPMDPEGSGVKPTSSGSLDMAAIAAGVSTHLMPAFRDLVREELQRGTQSIKDKTLKPLAGVDPAALKRVVDLVQKHGGDVDAAARELKIDAVLEGAQGGEDNSGSGGHRSGRTEPAAQDVAEQVRQRTETILERAGIPPTDEEFRQFVDQARKDKVPPAAYIDKLETWAWQETRKRAVSEGVAQLETGKTKPPDPKQVALKKEYDAEIAGVRGNVDRIFEVKRKFRGKGLEGVY